MYGILLACLKVTDHDVYLLQKLHQIRNDGNTVMTNEYDCPTYELVPVLYMISSSTIIKPVSTSFVHSCISTCGIQERPSKRMLERESVTIPTKIQLCFVHNLAHPIFCYNIYYIGNYKK